MSKKILVRRLSPAIGSYWKRIANEVPKSKNGWILATTRQDEDDYPYITIKLKDGSCRFFSKYNFETKPYSLKFEQYKKRLMDYAVRVSKKRRK